ncbi:TetR/AcrR family transcriptional regulator [Nocardioides pelophilus]|uniref:TetR/AcrR family transcriptional regulator n=1 Tax=Nocardioides pelophilus TaxID=2172019 RepID=UPI001601BD7B|nr:TetR/AcrR family transcriptional regulator [Nocardioides pelophilus]
MHQQEAGTELTDVRRRLIEAAARLLGEEGPSALSTRRLARETGTSTMAVYTHFGGMAALVSAVAAEGFRRLIARVAEVEPSDDPVGDFKRMAVAYRANALDNRYLYAVMFGSASLGGYRLDATATEVGEEAFTQLRDAVARAMDLGALRDGDPSAVAGQFWSALHGYVMLELAGYHQVTDDPEHDVLWPMLAHLLTDLSH